VGDKSLGSGRALSQKIDKLEVQQLLRVGMIGLHVPLVPEVGKNDVALAQGRAGQRAAVLGWEREGLGVGAYWKIFRDFDQTMGVGYCDSLSTGA
jgi:hypothetical protein